MRASGLPQLLMITINGITGFDISICVQPDVNATNENMIVRYPLNTPFKDARSEDVVSFVELAELPGKMWRNVK